MMARSHTFVGIFWFNNLGWRMESPSGWNHSTPGSFSLVTWKPKIDGNRKKGFFTFQNGQQIPLFTTRILGVFGFFMFSFLGCKRCSHFDSIGFFCFLLLFPCVFLFKFGSPFPVSFAVFFFKTSTLGGFLEGKIAPPTAASTFTRRWRCKRCRSMCLKVVYQGAGMEGMEGWMDDYNYN